MPGSESLESLLQINGLDVMHQVGQGSQDLVLVDVAPGRAELKAYIEGQKRMPSGRFQPVAGLLEAEGVLRKPSPETSA